MNVPFFRLYFLQFGLLDVFDIAIVAYIIYRFLLLMHGTRAISMMAGAGVILFLAFVSSWLEMESLRWLIARLATVWVIAFLIVFQPELRNILTQLGNAPIFRRIVGASSQRVVDNLMEVASVLSETKVGGLFILKRDVGLKGYEDSGKPINADVTPELLITIFTPHTPLHDGAVIIEGDKVIAAGCELPLTTNPRYQRTVGMRHRAGIGISEETDAVVVIISEETGNISLALRGHLRKNLSLDTLRKLLEITLKGRGE
jgi:diadenylate cyclase